MQQREEEYTSLKHAFELQVENHKQQLDTIVARDFQAEASSEAASLTADTPDKPSDHDNAFSQNVFEQSYDLHIVVYATSAVLLTSLKSSSSECRGPMKSVILDGLVTVVVACGLLRWFHRRAAARSAGLESSASKDEREGIGQPTSMMVTPTNLLAFSFVGFAVISLLSSLYFTPADLCNGPPGEIWDVLMPAWYAHIGPIEMLTGVMLVTHGLHLRTAIYLGIIAQLGMGVAQLYILLQAADEKHSVTSIVLNASVQHIAFFVGVFFGNGLIHGQRIYYDQAAKARAELLERRVEQLQAEKDRADYDFYLIQHTINRLRKTEDKTEGPLEEDVPRSGSHVSSQSHVSVDLTDGESISSDGAACSSHGAAAEPLQPAPASALPRTLARTLAPALAQTSSQAQAAPVAVSLAPGVTLPKDDSPAGKLLSGARPPPSTSGWSELSALIRIERHQHEQLDLTTPAAQIRDGAVPSTPSAPPVNNELALNPFAREWKPL